MGRIIFHAACSLDGFLARENDDFSWLFPYGPPEDYGYSDFIRGIGPIIMGSRTYEVILDFEKGKWNYRGHPVYVMTRRRGLPKPAGEDITFVSGGWKRLAGRLRKGRKDVWHMGGGLSLAPFLDAGLIDEIRLFVYPLLLKAGKPVFTGLKKELTLDLVASKASRSGVVLLQYRKQPRKPAVVAAKDLKRAKGRKGA